MIHIQQLFFHYRENGFHLSVSEFSVSEGEKVAVIGPSGSGKTTLLNLIAGIVMPISGAVHVGGVKISKLSNSGRRDFRIANIGFVFQDFELLDYLNVLDNILHPFRITRALKLDGAVKQSAAALAEEMGIGDKLSRMPGELSQGEKQRAAICRALLPRPKLILADEATGSLDPDNKLHILDSLLRAARGYEATVVAVTHDHELLDRFDRVIDFKNFHASQPLHSLEVH